MLKNRNETAKEKCGKMQSCSMPENMGPASKREIEDFAAYVLEVLGHDDFEMRWTTAGSILIPPIVYIDERFIGKVRYWAKEIVLHEIAHITTRTVDHKHGNLFYGRYIELLKQFMCQQ